MFAWVQVQTVVQCSTGHSQATAASTVCHRAAAATPTGERQQEQEPQHTAKQQEQEQPDPNDPYLRRPVPPPQHRLEQDECYFWSGSRMSAAAVAAAAAAVGGSSSDGGAVGEGGNAVSMDTSATTRMPHSQGHSELVSTAQSPSQSWASSLSRLKQLQLATREALLEGVVH